MKLNHLLSPPRFETGNGNGKATMNPKILSGFYSPCYNVPVFMTQNQTTELWFFTVRQYPWKENGNEIRNAEIKFRDRANGCRSQLLIWAELEQLVAWSWLELSCSNRLSRRLFLQGMCLLRLAVSLGLELGGRSLCKEASVCRSRILRHTEFHFIGGRRERSKGRIGPFFLVLFLLPFAELIQVLSPKSGLLGKQMRGGMRQ